MRCVHVSATPLAFSLLLQVAALPVISAAFESHCKYWASFWGKTCVGAVSNDIYWVCNIFSFLLSQQMG